jgi:hypothetical protein
MRHTRPEVVDRTLREFNALDSLIRRLRPEDWARLVPRPESRDPWTVKDAVVHIVYWKSHTARVVRGERRSPEMRGLDVPAINHLIWQRWRDRPPAEVVEWHRDVQLEVMEALAARPDEWFGRRERSAAWPADFDGHSAGHRRQDIEAALGGSDAHRALSKGERRTQRAG